MAKSFLATERYAGQYVAFRSRDDGTVIAAGEDPKEVFDMAKNRGIDKPIIAYVPAKERVLIY